MRIAIFVFVLTAGLRLCAHDPGLSSAELRIGASGIDVLLTFAIADAKTLASLSDHNTGWPQVGALLRDNVILTVDDGALPVSEPKLKLDKDGNCEVRMNAVRTAGSAISLKASYLELLPRGHRAFVTIRRADGELLTERVLDKANDSISAELGIGTPDSTHSNSFAGFLILGIEHILTGYDHLLFLFALLIVSRTFAASLKIITCFTFAHSVTLALATLEVVRLPGSLVEPVIAASIVYVGVENLVSKGGPKGRWLLTVVFGLIHGFGFASVLGDLGVSANAGGVALPIFAFNLGVELGQVAVAAVLLPVIWQLRRQPLFVPRWIPACSAAVALAGAFWFVQRVCGI
jgi:hydrogenase/urease accessory protein HupE